MKKNKEEQQGKSNRKVGKAKGEQRESEEK